MRMSAIDVVSLKNQITIMTAISIMMDDKHTHIRGELTKRISETLRAVNESKIWRED